MDPTLQSLLPALDNVPVFFLSSALLSGLLLLSLAQLWQLAWQREPGPLLRWLRAATAAATWLLVGLWLVIGAILGFIAGGSAGSLLLALAPPLLALLLLATLTLVLAAWLRRRPWADWLVAVAVAGFCIAVLATQRLWFCEPLGWAGFARAQVCTGRLYTTGTQGAIRKVGTASGWYAQAARRGDEEALAAFVAVESSRQVREAVLREAAARGNRAAAWQLFLLLGPEEGMPWLQAAVKSNYPEAIYQQSQFVHEGDFGYAPDPDEAYRLRLRAAELGSNAARAGLALGFERGDRPAGYSRAKSLRWEQRVDPQWTGAARWRPELARYRELRDAAGRGDTAAMLRIAADYETRSTRDPWYSDGARQWLVRAADAGAAEAQFELAFDAFHDPGVPPAELTTARDRLIAAAEQGHHYALSNAAYFLASGQHGFAVDLERARGYAVRWLEQLEADPSASERDRVLARQRVASLDRQLARERDRLAGREGLEEGVPAGDPEAQFRLAEKLDQYPEPGSFQRSRELLFAAATRGHLEARYRAAFATLSGPRSDAEEASAYAWMQDAADRGHRGALVFMGRAYLAGVPRQGIGKDPAGARRLLQAALAGLEGDVVYQRRNGSVTVMTTRESVEKTLAGIPGSTTVR